MLAARNPNAKVGPVTVSARVRCRGRYTIAADVVTGEPWAQIDSTVNAASRGADLGYSCWPVRYGSSGQAMFV